MEPKGSLVCTQEPTTSPYNESDKSSSQTISPAPQTIYVIFILLTSSHLNYVFKVAIFFRFVHQNPVCIFVPPVPQAPPLLSSFIWSLG